ncbi:hypothetical protein RvY_03268 [Ramazzottius varieornatus]|uniref:Ig-like domain-containing protein n=1 Tax=Ramazzottius varieornatus TaxID=947166 RepID=A0A1D1UUI2_RAMVA|nr:hypothetical protein RvY_03268 [Ramazzottius varieornatus]
MKCICVCDEVSIPLQNCRRRKFRIPPDEAGTSLLSLKHCGHLSFLRFRSRRGMAGTLIGVFLCMTLATLIHANCPILRNTTFACHGKLETAKEILQHLPHLLPNTTALDFSRNSISKLERNEFQNVTATLLTLNVSHNQIADVAAGAFTGMTELQVLDLSFNKLTVVSLESFRGLPKLQKLLLSDNPITQIQERSLELLPSITQLGISGTPLMCDCDLSWLSVRLRQGKLSLLQDAATTCFTPRLVRGRRLSSLRGEEFTCNESNPIELHRLDISPSHNQMVVAGDNFSMECWATNVLGEGGTHMVWSLGQSGLPANISVDFRLSDDRGLIVGRLNITQLSAQHNGNWTCFAYTSRNNQTTSRRLSVLDPVGVKCPSNHTLTTRGSFYWPETLALGQVTTIPCEAEQDDSPLASHICAPDGQWQKLDVSRCQLTSEFARVMGEYVARIGSQVSAESASFVPAILKTYILNETTDRVILDADYVDLVLQALENILSHAEGSTKASLHSEVLPIVNWLLNTSYTILEEGQQRLNLSQRIVQIILTTCSFMAETMPTSLKHFALNLVQLNRDEQVSCQVGMGELTRLQLECSGTIDKTDAVGLRNSTIRIHRDGNWEGRALVLAFRNVKIFAATLDRAHTPISMVIGVFPLHNQPGTAPRKWTVELQASGLPEQASPWAFSEQIKDMFGNCLEVERPEDSEFVKVQCGSIGTFVTIIQPLEVFLAQHTGSPRSTGAIPILVFIGCVLAIVVHLSLLFLYAIYFSSMVLDRVFRHSLLNTWSAVLALLLLYSTAFNYSPNRSVTAVVAFVLHYFTLTILTWIFLGLYTIFRHRRSVVARQRTGYSPQRAAAMQGLLEVDVEAARALPNGDIQGSGARVGLGGLYLFGWGVPVLVTCLAAFLHTNTRAQANLCLFLVPITVMILASFMLFVTIVISSRRKKKLVLSTVLDDGKLGYNYHATVLLLYLTLFVATLSLAALPYWLKDSTLSPYMAFVSVLVWNMEATVVFWLARKDLPKTCWDASKKLQAEENASRSVIALQHTVYAPLPSQTASVFQDEQPSFVGRTATTDGSARSSSLYENIKERPQRAAPSLADSSRLSSSLYIPVQVPKMETRI